MMADMQEQYDEMIEAAVEASGFKEADEVIKHVMSL
jgi:Arc/MetJ-type ribon-helix-helix transcriptional regulator